MQVPEVPLGRMALQRVHMLRSRLTLNTAVYFFRAGALSEARVHQQRIIRVGPNHFAMSLPSCGNPVTGQIQTLPHVLIFTEPKNRCLDSQSDWQTQANSLLYQSVLIGMPSRSSLLHPRAQFLH